MERFGALLDGARTRLALSQGALASLLGVSQQTVSRWEQGLSRPRPKMVRRLTEVLNLTPDEVAAAMGLSGGSARQGPNPALPSEDVPPPVRPLTPLLPLNSLTADQFERFVTDLLERQFPVAAISQLGGQGDDQRGYDIVVTQADGQRLGVQCKREQQFGPRKVAKAVSAAELEVGESVIALARPATA